MESAAYVGQEQRWLLSYSDLLTLLFSLFVVLFASAHVKPKAVPPVPEPASPVQDELISIQAKLNQSLAPAFATGKIDMAIETRGLVLQLHDASFFASGDDQIRADAFQTIAGIAEVLKSIHNAVSIEGHADAAAIHGERFKDNWQLSAARGVSVIRYLTAELGIPSTQLSAVAYADTRPRSENVSAEGRAQNRRVDIVIHRDPERAR